jgi:tetratricopeptide (TPR) repeat protein
MDPDEPNSSIRLLPWVFDGEALIGPGMKDARGGKPVVGQFRHPIPCEAVLLALGQYYKLTSESTREAIELLGRALAIDPSYAPAAALVGVCRIAQRLQGWHRLSDQECAEAVRLARQSIAAGKDDPDALSSAALTIAYLAGEHATAAGAIDRALALNPNFVGAWLTRGWMECWQNRPGSAIQAVERATRQCRSARTLTATRHCSPWPT